MTDSHTSRSRRQTQRERLQQSWSNKYISRQDISANHTFKFDYGINEPASNNVYGLAIMTCHLWIDGQEDLLYRAGCMSLFLICMPGVTTQMYREEWRTGANMCEHGSRVRSHITGHCQRGVFVCVRIEQLKEKDAVAKSQANASWTHHYWPYALLCISNGLSVKKDSFQSKCHIVPHAWWAS